MANKTDKIVEMAHQKSSARKAEVIEAIKRMKREGKKITFYGVMKETGASKSYLYTNQEIYDTIVQARDGQKPKESRSSQSKDTIIKMQKARIAALERENSNYKAENGETFKAKYLKVLAENEELKKQLQAAYEY